MEKGFYFFLGLIAATSAFAADAVDEDQPYCRVCFSLFEPGPLENEEAFQMSMPPGPAKTVRAYVDASEKCTVLLAAITKDARLLDRVIVKGTTLPLELLEVKHPFSPEGFEDIVARYNSAFADYERGDFGAAQQAFAVLAEERGDKPSALMVERCREVAAERPVQWNGIYHSKQSNIF